MKKKASGKPIKPVAATSELTAPQPGPPAEDSDQVDGHIAEAVTGKSETSQTASDEPLPNNRAAFLLGLYVELPAVDAIVEPLVQLSVMLSIPKLILLDSALARLGKYDVEQTLFPPAGSFEHERLDPADKRQCFAMSFLSSTEHDKVRTIAGLLWEGQTELAAWYRAGKAIGALVEARDRCRRLPTPKEVTFAKTCLQQAASHWGAELLSESGSGLAAWLTQWDDQFEVTVAAEAKTKSTALEIEGARRKEAKNIGLRAVETLAAQIQDRPEDARSENQRMQDECDQFIYEKFFAGHDATEVRELLRQKTEAKNLKWPVIPSKRDLRAIANGYAERFHKERIPAGKSGRPKTRNRK